MSSLMMNSVVGSGPVVYDESVVVPLQNEVTELCRSGSGLPLDKCLYLLRLYRLYPSTAELSCVLRILLNQMAVKAHDPCEVLTPQSMYNTPEIRQFQEFSNALHFSKFASLWSLIDQYRSFITEYCPDFSHRIRLQIANTMAQTFVNIKVEDACHLLNESDPKKIESLHPNFKVKDGILSTGFTSSKSSAHESGPGCTQKVIFETIKKLDELSAQ